MSAITQLRARYIDLLNGIISGYPLCCVLRFATCRFAYQNARRGGIDSGEHRWVACGIFHSGTYGRRDGWTIPPDRYDVSRAEFLPELLLLRRSHQREVIPMAILAVWELVSQRHGDLLATVVAGVDPRNRVGVTVLRHDSDLPADLTSEAATGTLAPTSGRCS